MNKLKILRKAKKLTQKQVADAVGIGMQAYAYYEKAEREPSQETLLKLADFFGVTVDELLGRSSEPQLFDNARVDRPEILDIWDKLTQEQQENIINYAQGLVELNEMRARASENKSDIA